MKREGDFVVVSWNCDGVLSSSRELDLLNLLDSTEADVATLSQAEIPAASAPFAVNGYATFYPTTEADAKVRVLVLVKTKLAAQANAGVVDSLQSTDFPS